MTNKFKFDLMSSVCHAANGNGGNKGKAISTKPAKPSDEVLACVAAYKSEYETDTMLTHAQIQELWDASVKNEEQLTVEDMRAKEAELNLIDNEEDADAEDEGQDLVAVSGDVGVTDQQAAKFGKHLAENAEFTASVHDAIETENKRHRLSVAVAIAMSKTVKADELRALPYPGTRYDEEDAEGNRLYDQGDGLSNKPKPDVGKPGTAAFWAVVFASTPEGIALSGKIKALKGLTSPDQLPAPQYPEYKDQSQEWYTAELGNLQVNGKTGVNVLREAVKIILKMDDMEKRLKNCHAAFRLDSKGNLLRTTMPIQIYKDVPIAGAPDKMRIVDKFMPTKKFLKVNIDNVAKTSDHYAAFQAPAGVRGAGNKDKNNTSTIKIDTVIQSETAMLQIRELFTGKTEQDNKTRLLNRLNQKDSDGFLLALHTVQELADWVFQRKAMSDRLNKLLDQANPDEAAANTAEGLKPNATVKVA